MRIYGVSFCKFKILLMTAVLTLATPAYAVVGGVTDGHVVWPAYANYYNMDQRIRIDVAPLTSLNQGWFWASQFFAGAMGGYMGFQQLPNGQRTAHFAIWNTTAAFAGSGFKAEPFGGEGVGMKVYGNYPWVEGRMYRWRIWNLGNNWWGFWVLDEVTGIDTYVGQIQNQNDPGKMLNYSATFTELWAGATTCSQASAVHSTWPLPTANGNTVVASSATSSVIAASGCGAQAAGAVNLAGHTGEISQIVCAANAKANLLSDGACWRYGSLNQSCADVCKTNGMDAVFWKNGQNMSNAQCTTLHRSFGNSSTVVNGNWPNVGAGCISYITQGPRSGDAVQLWNILSPPWDQNAKNLNTQRMCGCAG